MRILVTGTTGQVGWELLRALHGLGEILPAPRSRLDLTDPDALRAVVRDARPDLLIHPAAYTAVDRAETEPELAHAVNAVAPGILAEEMARLKGAMIHYSTDYVFDGTLTRPYREDDAPNPLGAYGRSKLAGEAAVAASGVDHLILRTTWVYGLRGGNFLRTMQRLGRERSTLRVIDDQFGAPTWSRSLASATAILVARAFEGRGAHGAALRSEGGIYHLTCAGETTWCGFAREIFARDPSYSVQVEAIPTTAYPLPAARPANSRLSGEKIRAAFGIALPHWEIALGQCLEEC